MVTITFNNVDCGIIVGFDINCGTNFQDPDCPEEVFSSGTDDSKLIDYFSTLVSNKVTPAVISGPLTFNDQIFATSQLSNVGPDNFNLSINEFEYSDNTHEIESIPILPLILEFMI